MQALFIHQRCIEPIKGEAVMSTTMSEAYKTEMVGKTRCANILFFRDKVLKEVAKKTIMASMWTKLESLDHRHFLKNGYILFEW